jgi:hypothetical protein
MSSRTRGYQYDAASARLFAAMLSGGGQLSDPRRRIVDLTIRRLKAQGIWDKLDCLYMFAALNSASALINWKNPGTFNAAVVSSPTFTADRGYTGVAGGNYLTSNFTPSSAGGVFVQDSAHVSVRSLSVGVSAGDGQFLVGGTGSGVQTNFNPRRSSGGGGVVAVVNGGSAAVVANSDTDGLFCLNRSGAAAVQFYRNASSLTTGTGASTGNTDSAIRFLNHGGVNQSTYQIASASIGSSLTAQEVAAYMAIELAYMKAVGAL